MSRLRGCSQQACPRFFTIFGSPFLPPMANPPADSRAALLRPPVFIQIETRVLFLAQLRSDAFFPPFRTPSRSHPLHFPPPPSARRPFPPSRRNVSSFPLATRRIALGVPCPRFPLRTITSSGPLSQCRHQLVLIFPSISRFKFDVSMPLINLGDPRAFCRPRPLHRAPREEI